MAGEPAAGTGSRLGRVAASLLSAHVELAQQEAARDQQRLLRAAILLGAGALLLTAGVLMLQVAGVCLLHQLGRSWLQAVLLVAGGDALLGLLCLLGGRSKLQAPVLPQTRSTIRRTLAALTTESP